jgi:transcriptional regulator with XRE-family HTH domain
MAERQTIQQLMKAAKITQKQLAEKLGKSQPTISEILNPKSNPTIRTIREIADALCVDIGLVAAHYDIWNDSSGGEHEDN